ncbi:hypothetical protein [Streptomyces sp. CA-146814]|uniref:hypothetical protein n=1 Tax=Streptomyces sp. CA-146814 TaxID=3240053 RepID=UPI003D8E04ED
MATEAGLWGAGLEAWYGPGTPLVQRVRSYRPPPCGERRRYTWSIGADTVALGAVVCAVAGLIGQS